MKKIIIKIFLILVFIVGNCAMAQDNLGNVLDSTSVESSDNQGINTKEEYLFVDSRIKKELKNSIQNVYGQDNVQNIYDNIIKHAQISIENRPLNLKQQDLERNSD